MTGHAVDYNRLSYPTRLNVDHSHAAEPHVENGCCPK